MTTQTLSAPVIVEQASVSPEESLHLLSRSEIEQLYGASDTELYQVFRRCALAVMNSGSPDDDTKSVLETYKNFDIKIIQRERGIKLEIVNAPASAFVDGEMIKGIKEHLFAVLRDVIFQQSDFVKHDGRKISNPSAITDAVFKVLRNANALIHAKEPNLVVCWGGHSISPLEYDYTKLVGYEFGLRGLDVCTGCGPGAMKGPMKGAAVAHRKQRNRTGRYVGISEPGIIAAESPNPIVNELIVMPDIEKRLEAFVRLGHGIVVFPGGVGTAEEIFYILGLMLHEKNKGTRIPVIFTAPPESTEYFEALDKFIRLTLGDEASSLYEVIVDNPTLVAQKMADGMHKVRDQRKDKQDAFYFNWVLHIPEELQNPFEATHENMSRLNLSRDQSAFELAVNLRAMFSGLVAGNVKSEGIQAIAEKGNFQLSGSPEIMHEVDNFLRAFVEHGRMKINASEYKPCYDIVM